MAKLHGRKISNRTVESLSVADRDAVFWDRELLGFGVRVYPSGAKVYVVQTRREGRSKRVTVGRHGVISAARARRRAALMLARLRAGEDPLPPPRRAAVGPRGHGGRPRGAVPPRVRRGALQAVDDDDLPGGSGAVDPPRPRPAAGRRGQPPPRRGPSLSPARHPLPGQPGGGDPQPDVQPRRGLGPAARRRPPLPLDPEVPGAPPGAVPLRGGVPAARAGPGRGRGAPPGPGGGAGSGCRWRRPCAFSC